LLTFQRPDAIINGVRKGRQKCRRHMGYEQIINDENRGHDIGKTGIDSSTGRTGGRGVSEPLSTWISDAGV